VAFDACDPASARSIADVFSSRGIAIDPAGLSGDPSDGAGAGTRPEVRSAPSIRVVSGQMVATGSREHSSKVHGQAAGTLVLEILGDVPEADADIETGTGAGKNTASANSGNDTNRENDRDGDASGARELIGRR